MRSMIKQVLVRFVSERVVYLLSSITFLFQSDKKKNETLPPKEEAALHFSFITFTEERQMKRKENNTHKNKVKNICFNTETKCKEA
jgi:hypothetical protein